MAVDHCYGHDLKSVSAAVDDSEKTSACFDCSICLDFASEPVVTLCGHLYCWPCIYEWFNVQDNSGEHLQCPVCKTELSKNSLVPLYGRGKQLSETEPESKLSSVKVPPRPSPIAQSVQELQYQSSPRPVHSHRAPNQELRNYPVMNMNHPIDGMFGEMVYARVFGNSAYPNLYHLVGNNNPRLRRQEMQVDKSLSRLTFFLFCCLLLCLLLF